MLEANINPDRAVGYTIKNPLKIRFNNFGSTSNIFYFSGDEDIGPDGLYGDYQYLSVYSFIFGIPGRDSLGNPYPWAMRQEVDSLTGQPIPGSTVYWGPTVSESWFDRTYDKHMVEWEPVENSQVMLFGNVLNSAYAFDLFYNWAYPELPLMAHSDFLASWPAPNGFPQWPGFRLMDGSSLSREHFSDQDVYWEMDDRFANRDTDPTQGYPTGVRVKAMASNFQNIPGAFVIIHYRLINQTSYDYPDAYAGIYFDPDIYRRKANGSFTGNSSTDDMMQYNRKHQVVYVWDWNSYPAANPLAYLGASLLQTPPASRPIDLNADGVADVTIGEPTGVSGWHGFDWFFRPGSNDQPNGPFSGVDGAPVSPDKEAIQFKLMAGDTSDTDSPPAWHQRNRQHFFHPNASGFLNPRFDANDWFPAHYPGGLDCATILSCGPFNLNSGDSVDVVAAIFAGQDSLQILREKEMVQSIWEKQRTYPDIHLTSGNGGEIFSSTISLNWNIDPTYPYSANKVDIWLGYGFNKTWSLLDTAVTNTGQYSTPLNDIPDGIFYRAGIVSYQGDGFVYGISDSFFTVNNPNVESDPELILFSPRNGDTLSGIIQANLLAGDADQDSIYVTVDYQFFNRWISSISHIPYVQPFPLDSRRFINGNTRLRFLITDQNGNYSQTVTRDVFVKNLSVTAPDSIFHHVSGVGNGFLQLNPIDPNQMTHHLYRLTFDSSQHPRAYLYDVDAGAPIVENLTYINSPQNIDFDGLNLKIGGFDSPEFDSTYWKIGNSDWTTTCTFVVSNPAKYEIVFGNANADTAYNAFNPTNPVFTVPFQVFNRSFGIDTALKLLVYDRFPIGIFSSDDKFYVVEHVVERDTFANGKKTLAFSFHWTGASTNPLPGDVYRISTIGYFWEADTIFFRVPDWLGIHKAPIPEDFVLYPNFPNPFNPRTTIRYQLPQNAQIRMEIFNILGQRVITLVDSRQQAGRYQVVWNGKNQSGNRVASGVYILRLQAGNRVKTMKMVLLK